MFHPALFQVARAAECLPAFYYLWAGMNDSCAGRFLSTDDYGNLNDGRRLSGLPSRSPGGDK